MGKRLGHSEMRILRSWCSPWPCLQEPEQSVPGWHGPILKHEERADKIEGQETSWSLGTLYPEGHFIWRVTLCVAQEGCRLPSSTAAPRYPGWKS